MEKIAQDPVLSNGWKECTHFVQRARKPSFQIKRICRMAHDSLFLREGPLEKWCRGRGGGGWVGKIQKKSWMGRWLKKIIVQRRSEEKNYCRVNSTVGRTNCTRLKDILAAYTAALWILEDSPDSTDFLYKLLTKRKFFLSRLTHFGARTPLLWIYTSGHGLKVIEPFATKIDLAWFVFWKPQHIGMIV